MKISVITATWNSERTIGASIDTLSRQVLAGHQVEHIVIDGGSTDRTVEIVRAKNPNAVVVSEPDDGIYDALNKGIKLASGDVIGFLHSDDMYEHDHVLQLVLDRFVSTGADLVYGDLVYCDELDTSKLKRHWRSGPFALHKLARGWMPPHPTVHWDVGYLKKVGCFDTSFKIAADYEHLLRALSSDYVKTSYIDQVLVRMRSGGVSNRSVTNLILKTREDLKAARRHIGEFGLISVILKNLSKLSQIRI